MEWKKIEQMLYYFPINWFQPDLVIFQQEITVIGDMTWL